MMQANIYVEASFLKEKISNISLTEHLVIKSVQPYFKKGRNNIMTHNFFTSLKLTEKLRTENTSTVETMRGRRRGVPTTNL